MNQPALRYMVDLGEEVARFVHAHNKGLPETRALLDRCLGVIDLCRESGISAAGRKEISILRDVLIDSISNQPQYKVSGEDLESYFMPFTTRLVSHP